MFMVTRVLILTQNVAYSMQTAGALEKPGAFRVVPFTSGDNALTHLRAHPQDVMLVDVTLPGLDAAAFVQEARETQPDIAIIVMPDVDVARRLMMELGLHGIIDFSWTARKLVPLIKEAQRQVYEAQPGTARVKTIREDEETSRIEPVAAPEPPVFQPEEVLKSDPMEVIIFDEQGQTRLEIPAEMQQQGQLFQEADKAVDIFQKLAAEEPPMPSFEESGTIRDLKAAMSDADSISRMAATFNEEATKPQPAADDEPPSEDSQSIPAAVILASATDDSTPLDSFSLDEFLARIQEQMPDTGRTIQPLPSWVAESEKYVREPDFLPDDLALLSASQPLEYTATTTTPSEAQQPEADIGQLETEVSEPIVHSRPATPEDLTLPAPETAAAPEPETMVEESATTTPGEIRPETGRIPAAPVEVVPPQKQFIHVAPGDDYVARLAVTLTQVSLELAAEATVLARSGQMVAYAGLLPMEDIDEIRDTIAGDWEASPAQGRIRFITLQSSGKDYMLYSRGVEGGFTLSMIFSGTQQLQRIRRQGKRLAEALAAVPSVPPAEAIRPAEDEYPLEETETGTPEPLTFVWLLRNPDTTLDNETMQALVRGLDVQLTRKGWQIRTLDVHEDYIYLFADVPAVLPTTERIRELMRRSGEIVRKHQPALETTRLWADSYLVLTPGRELRQEEIQDFLYFVGM